MLPSTVGGVAPILSGPHHLRRHIRLLHDKAEEMSEREVRHDRAPESATHLREQAGQALAEYGLILAFIAAASVLALGALGFALFGGFDAVTARFP